MSILRAPQGFKCGLSYRVRYAATGIAMPLQFVGVYTGSVHTQEGWIAHFTLSGHDWPVHHCALMVCTPVSDTERDTAPDPILTQHMRAGRIGVMRATTDTPTHKGKE